MNALPALLTALLLLALPAWGDQGQPSDRALLIAEAGIEAADETPAIPEPRSMIFVGLGALVVLAFALRRK